MMKQMLKRMLALALCLSVLGSSAMAVNATVLSPDGEYSNVRNIVAVGDTIYLFETTGVEADLYRWTADMQTAEHLAGGLLYAERYSTIAEMEAAIPGLSTEENADAVHALSLIV